MVENKVGNTVSVTYDFKLDKNVIVYEEKVGGVESSASSETKSEGAVPDFPTSWKVLTYWIFFLQGLSTVLPWNVLITAFDLFNFLYSKSIFAYNFNNYFAVIFTSTQVLLLVPVTLTQNKNILYKRILIIWLVISIGFVLLLLLPFLKGSDLMNPESYFYITLVPIVIFGGCGVYAITDVYGLVANFPPIYIQGVMTGQAIGGLAVALFQLVIQVVGNQPGVEQVQSEVEAAILLRGKLYFTVALAVALLTTLALLTLPRSPLYKHYFSTKLPQTQIKFDLATIRQDFWKALQKVKLLVISETLVYTITLALFPAITAAVQTSYSDSSPLYKQLFVPIHFVLFNLGDLIGRMLLSVPFLRPKTTKFVFILTNLRLVFFLVFLTCNLNLNASTSSKSWPIWFKNDYLYFFFMLLFAISSGYLGSGAMVLAPSLATPGPQVGLVSNLLALALVIGLALGSFLSFGLRAAVCQCNSFLS